MSVRLDYFSMKPRSHHNYEQVRSVDILTSHKCDNHSKFVCFLSDGIWCCHIWEQSCADNCLPKCMFCRRITCFCCTIANNLCMIAWNCCTINLNFCIMACDSQTIICDCHKSAAVWDGRTMAMSDFTWYKDNGTTACSQIRSQGL